MNIEPSTALAILLPLVGAVIWLVRLEGRVNLADERHKDIRADLAEIKTDVKRILGGGAA